MTGRDASARIADGLAEEFLGSAQWAETTEEVKALVIGNVKGFAIMVAQYLRDEKPPAVDPLWRVRDGSMTALVTTLAREIDRVHPESAGRMDVSRERLFLMETLATIAGVYFRNLVNPTVGDARRADLAAEYARIWLTEFQAAVLRYEAIDAEG